MSIASYRELKVWEKGMALNVACHQVIILLPKTERYDIGSQLRRSAISIPANIAEGYGRSHLREYLQYLSIANGSLNETETYLLLIQRLKLVPENETAPALETAKEAGKMLTRMRGKLAVRLGASKRPVKR